MKKFLFLQVTTATLGIILTACNSTTTKTQAEVPQMTQPIVQEAPTTETISATANTSIPVVQFTTDGATPEQLEETYYKNVGEEKAIEADIERLKMDFRMNRIAAEEFQKQKLALEQQENLLEQQIDPFDDKMPLSALPENWVDFSNMEQMLQKMNELEIAEEQLELAMDKAEQEYISDAITRDAYIQTVIELEKQKDILEKQEDLLEDKLELMGWDD